MENKGAASIGRSECVWITGWPHCTWIQCFTFWILVQDMELTGIEGVGVVSDLVSLSHYLQLPAKNPQGLNKLQHPHMGDVGFSLDHIFQGMGDNLLVIAEMILGCVGTPFINTESHPKHPISSFSPSSWSCKRKFGHLSRNSPTFASSTFLAEWDQISDSAYRPFSTLHLIPHEAATAILKQKANHTTSLL